MLQDIVHYTEIEDRGGVLFLFDTRRNGLLCRQMEDLDKVYHRIRQMLVENDFPTTKRWITAIAQRGSDGLQEVIVEENEAEAKRLKVPRQVAEQWKRTATQEVSPEVWQSADKLCIDIDGFSRSLPPMVYGYTEEEGVFVDKESGRETIKALCSCEVTDEIRTKADTIITLAKQMRAMELQGINCIELASKYAQREEVTPGLDVFADIATRTHTPGGIAPPHGMGNVFNYIGMNHAPMKTL